MKNLYLITAKQSTNASLIFNVGAESILTATELALKYINDNATIGVSPAKIEEVKFVGKLLITV